MFKQEDIVKTVDGKPVLYLRRWHLLKTPWFKIYLHKIFTPDLDRDPHDHPWDSWIFILSGQYIEKLFFNNSGVIDLATGSITLQRPAVEHRGWLTFRKMPAETIHKIIVIDNPVWTLFICGKKKRDWGFHTKEGWVYWRDYIKNYEVTGAL